MNWPIEKHWITVSKHFYPCLVIILRAEFATYATSTSLLNFTHTASPLNLNHYKINNGNGKEMQNLKINQKIMLVSVPDLLF